MNKTKTKVLKTAHGLIAMIPSELINFEAAVVRAEKKHGVTLERIALRGEYDSLTKFPAPALP